MINHEIDGHDQRWVCRSFSPKPWLLRWKLWIWRGLKPGSLGTSKIWGACSIHFWGRVWWLLPLPWFTTFYHINIPNRSSLMIFPWYRCIPHIYKPSSLDIIDDIPMISIYVNLCWSVEKQHFQDGQADVELVSLAKAIPGLLRIPSGDDKHFAIENGHRNCWFTH